MENMKTSGIFFNERDIKAIVERYVDWAEVVDNQVICAHNVMSDATPIGTSIIVGIDGIKCDEGSDELRLIASAGIYEFPVKTTHTNDEINIRFDSTIPIPGTFGKIDGDNLDILTDEEKEFSKIVDELLGDREDEYANDFRRDNTRKVGGRGLVLLEKIKAEIKNDEILSSENVSPIQLASVFIELTDKYMNACRNVTELTERHDGLVAQYQETFEEGSKHTKRLARDIDVVNRKIDSNRRVGDFCLATINAAVKPMLDIVVER